MKYRNSLKQLTATMNEQEYNIPKNEGDIITAHLKLIKQLDVISSSSIAVFNLQKTKFEYLSSAGKFIKGFKKDQGYLDPFVFYTQMHPEDREFVIENQVRFLKLLINLPVSQRKKYKLCEDFRMKDDKDEWFRLVSQVQVLELDLSGNIWLTTDTIDLSPDIDISKSSNAMLLNIETKDRVIFGDQTEVNISIREKEVLHLLSTGASSKEISSQLYISFNTVNNHRKNIIHKLNVVNTAQAVRLGASLGII
jgi:DNA-binding CsgD family transcriptional regulator